ncbi:MAG: helicase associated domain-containing protein [Clostridia bacterium]
MARRISVRSIQQCLEDNAFGEIDSTYTALAVREAKLILNKLIESGISEDEYFDITKANEIINLVKSKIIPTLQYFTINMGKQKVRQVQKGGIDQSADISAQQRRLTGCAYKVLGDCYNYIGDITEATLYYEKAQRCGVDCSQELTILDETNSTSILQGHINNAKSLGGRTYEEMTNKISEYAYKIVDRILQRGEDILSNDVEDNLKTALSTYLRNEVGGAKDYPPMSNLAGGFEKMLKEFFYIPYARYLDENEQNSDISPTCQRLRRQKIAKGNISFSMFGNGFTLGNIKPLIVSGFNEDGTFQIDQTFYNFITKYYHIDNANFSEEDFANLVKFVEAFRNTIRNHTGHGVGIHRQTFAIVCEEMMLKDNAWIKKIIEMTNCKDFTVRRFDIKTFAIELRDFVSVFGYYPKINSTNNSEKLLAKRVVAIRAAKRRGVGLKLTEQDIGILNEIGFVWEEKLDWFNDAYTSLLQYKNEYGTLNIPDYYVDENGNHLGQKVYMLRKRYEDKQLSLTQTEILRNIGFEFELQNENSKWFDNFYQELVEYKAVFGNFKGVIQDKILGSQVMWFVTCYQKQKLGKATNIKITRQMVLKLKEIGFVLKEAYEPKQNKEDENNFTI